MTTFGAELWRQGMEQTFGRLSPDYEGAPTGAMSGAVLGPLMAYRVSGTPQVLRRSAAAVRSEPVDHLKLCLQLEGIATVSQGGRQVRVGPGQMAMYDTARPYDLRLERQWSCAVLTFPRDALSLPDRVLGRAMGQAHAIRQGPGAVLTDFVAAAVAQRGAIGLAGGRLGEAGLHLIASALSMSEPLLSEAGLADAQRLQILHYVREHLGDPDLTHDRVAAAHRMAPRSLHRLFEQEPHTVTEYIRRQRLESARRDLLDPRLSRLSIARIAARWCFVSQAHFTRAFQAQFTLLPSVVRRAGASGGE